MGNFFRGAASPSKSMGASEGAANLGRLRNVNYLPNVA